MSEDKAEDMIHALAYNTPRTVSETGCRLTSYRENAVDAPSVPLKWPSYHQPLVYQRNRNYSTNDFANSSILPSIEQQPSSSWNYRFDHEPSSAYLSQACPRSYPIDKGTVLQTYLRPNQQIYPPSEFPTNIPGQFIRRPDVLQPQTSIELLQDLMIEDQTSQSHLGDDLVSSYTPTIASSPPYSRQFDFSAQPSVEPLDDFDGFNGCATMLDDYGEEDGGLNSEPYARLIYRALKSAPEHKMVLKEIYEWFEKNTDKAKDTTSKGWQNSIRHNLSMNGAFKKVEQPPSAEESKKGFVWVLEASAIREGVKSTTRYRKTSSNKRVGKAEHPAPQRQRSGAKGGKAAKKAARQRRNARQLHYSSYRHDLGNPLGTSPQTTDPDRDEFLTMIPLNQANTQPYHLEAFALPPRPSFPAHRDYRLDDITGLSQGLQDDALYYDELDSPGGLTFPCIPSPDSGDTFLGGLSCMS